MNTEKGKPMVLCNGHLMIQERKSANGLRQYWRCPMQRKGCRGRAVSRAGLSDLTETVAHDMHGSSPAEIKKRKALNNIKRMAVENLAMTSKDIVLAAKAQLNDAEIQTFLKNVNVKKLITNARKPARG